MTASRCFFACELIAKRGHETTGLSLVASYLYQGFSDFGRSVSRPLVTLLLSWIFSAMYLAPCPAAGLCVKAGDGLIKAASFLFPFLGAARNELMKDMPVGDLIVGFGLGGIGVLCLFLIGLALRNRFRI
ncbi:MAG: hypothetical protein HQ483_14025 [Rhodospirillales bacterium]|nr:hypothetical protein [Rhodospirillales bacterium]